MKKAYRDHHEGWFFVELISNSKSRIREPSQRKHKGQFLCKRGRTPEPVQVVTWHLILQRLTQFDTGVYGCKTCAQWYRRRTGTTIIKWFTNHRYWLYPFRSVRFLKKFGFIVLLKWTCLHFCLLPSLVRPSTVLSQKTTARFVRVSRRLTEWETRKLLGPTSKVGCTGSQGWLLVAFGVARQLSIWTTPCLSQRPLGIY